MKLFEKSVDEKRYFASIVISIENLKTLKYKFSIKHWFILLFVKSVAVKIKNIYKEEESIEILKIIGLINNMEKYQINI